MALQAATPQTTITKDSQILEKMAVMNPDLPSPVLQNSYVVLGCWLVQGPEKRGVLQCCKTKPSNYQDGTDRQNHGTAACGCSLQCSCRQGYP